MPRVVASSIRGERAIAFLLALLCALLPLAGSPGAWVQEATPAASAEATGDWPMFRGDPAHTGAMSGSGPSGEVGVRWRVETDGGWNSAAVVDGVVYAPSDANYLFALDAATGEELWRFARAAEFSSPAVADGMIVIGSNEAILGIDAATGEERWRVELEGDPTWIASSAAIVDGVA